MQVRFGPLLCVMALFTCSCGGGGGTLVSIQVSPASPSLAVGNKQQFTATGTYSDNSTQDLTSTTTWSSSSTTVATISNSGLATTATVGKTTISATSGSVIGSTSFFVTSAATGITDSTGTATLTANDLTVLIQLVDQDTGAPLTDIAVALGNDPTVSGIRCSSCFSKVLPRQAVAIDSGSPLRKLRRRVAPRQRR
jgi:hypothetical protein